MNQRSNAAKSSADRGSLNSPKRAEFLHTLTRLRELGLNSIELIRSEAQYLPRILHPGEFIGGAVAGRDAERGHIMIVATDKRVIILDCKPIFKDSEDITYRVVAGVSVGNVGLIHSVTLHTRLGDFTIKTLYAKAAKQFKDYIDERCIERQDAGADYD